MNIYFPSNPSRARKAVILFYGLPRHYPLDYSNPAVRNFLEEGFIVFAPEYEGTFGSGEKFSCAGSLRSALETINLVKRGACKDFWSSKKLRWRVNEIVLAGASFGGAVALVAGAKSPSVKTIVSLAPVTHFGEHSRAKEKEESFAALGRQIERAFPRLWNLDGGEWKKMERGEVVLNAVDYVEELSGKNILLIHSEDDDVVSPRRSKDLLALLEIAAGKGKTKLVLLAKAGHVGIGLLGSKKVFARVKKFLRK